VTWFKKEKKATYVKNLFGDKCLWNC